ncbi:hypothetical protein [Kineococcus terrestris]|uniref:hypothetical protein n=1 Tax=Kineococcus terrestris TaxID=2044856 RepID=UPI0034DB55BA
MTEPLPPEWDSWLEEGARLLAVPPLRRNEQSTRGPEDPKFALGDFLLGVPAELVERLEGALSVGSGQFRTYREVASKVPPERRVAASWTVHRDLRDRPELLRDGLTVRAAAALLGKQPIDSKPDRRLTVEDRAKKVRAALADPDVYALIDAELGRDRAERQMRRRAREVHSEYAQRRRELEAEVRELRSAKSAFEATVQAELDINKALQLVEAIGETFEHLPQPDRLLDALTELNTAIAVLLLRQGGADEADAPIIIDGEAWEDRPARAALASSNQRNFPGEGRTVTDAVE